MFLVAGSLALCGVLSGLYQYVERHNANSTGNFKIVSLFSGGDFLAQALFFLPGLGGEVFAEIASLEYRTNIDIRLAGHRIRAALQPFNRLFHGSHLPDPVASD